MLAVVVDCKCVVDPSSKSARQEPMSSESVLVCRNLEFDLPRETVQLIEVAVAVVAVHIAAEVVPHIAAEAAPRIVAVAAHIAAEALHIAAAAHIAEAMRIPVGADSHLAEADNHLAAAVHSPVVVRNPEADSPPVDSHLAAVAHSHLAVDTLALEQDTAHQVSVKATAEEATAEMGTQKNQS